MQRLTMTSSNSPAGMPGSRRGMTAAIAGTVAVAFAAVAAISHSPTVRASDGATAAVPRPDGWVVKSIQQFDAPAPLKSVAKEQAALKALVAKRTPGDLARFQWWATGGPVYRWNEILLDEMQEAFVTLPLAARHLALFHAALDDAVAIAESQRRMPARADHVAADAAIKSAPNAVNPSAYAAAAAAAADVLAYLFPERAAIHAARAEEAIQTRLVAAVELPSDVAAGRAIGQRVAALAIARGRSDGSDAKWTGSVPEGAGKWKGANPIAPLAPTWQPWVLAHAAEFRPSAPPSVDSDAVQTALNELKTFARTPKTNHRAIYWEVHGGARAHTLWNEIARTKLLEQGAPPAMASRVLAALNIAFSDAGIACWDAKYAYWYIRPSQFDSELRPLFPPPSHPSYPAAHGCFSTAAATVLAHVFPQDRERLLALGREAAEARIWAGIHYRFDIDAGQELGRKVAQKTIVRAFADRSH